MRRRSKAGKRGFSSVVGAIFMVLIMWVLATNYFIYTLSQNTGYNNAVGLMSQVDTNRKSESIQVANTGYAAYDNGSVTVSAQINNTGPISVRFVTLWVHVYNSSWTNYNFTGQLPPNPNVKGGAAYDINVNVNVSGVNTNGTYTFASWLITARGNSVGLQKTTMTNNIIIAQTTQGIGAVMMDFKNFTYYNVTGSKAPYSLANYPNGASGYLVQGAYQGQIAFRVIITNLDQDQRLISLDANSVLFAIFPTLGTQPRGAYWYIATIDSTGNIVNTYNPLVLPYNTAVAVYFASINPGTYSPAGSAYKGIGAVNLALTGTIGGSPFGQNIPFVTINVAS